MAVVLCGIASLFLLVRTSSSGVADAEGRTSSATGAAPDPGISGFGMFTSVDFYILALTLTVVQGSGLLWLNHAPQISEALLGKTSDSTAYVATISCFNGLGRLIFGNLSEYTLKYFSRVWYFFCIHVCLHLRVRSCCCRWRPGALAGWLLGRLRVWWALGSAAGTHPRALWYP